MIKQIVCKCGNIYITEMTIGKFQTVRCVCGEVVDIG
jgi:hypothetical protein